MALKYNITKDEFDALSEDMRKEYGEVNGRPGTFRLQLSDNPVGEFRETNERLMRELREITESNTTNKTKAEQAEATLQRYRDDDGNALDPEEIKRLRKAVVEKAGGKRDASFEDALNAAIGPLKQQLQSVNDKLAQAEAATKAEQDANKRQALRAELIARAEPVLVKGGADFVVPSMLDAFDYDPATKTITAKTHESDGTLITPERYLDNLRGRSPGLFKGSGDNVQDNGPRLDRRADGVKVLHDPTPLQVGEHQQSIREGKTVVVRSGRG